MRINKKQFNKWLISLYSEKRPQGKYRLQTRIGFCCLGDACMEIIPESKLSLVSGLLTGTMPESQKHCPKWLMEFAKDFSLKTNEELTEMNDSKNYKFPEIAMILDLIYNYKALD